VIFLYRFLSPGANSGSDLWKQDFQDGCQIASQVISCCASIPGGMDQLLAGAHLARLSLAKMDLQGEETRQGGGVDVQQPSVLEVKLIVPPVSALRSRVKQLLEEWPGNPLLEQLVAICGRLLGEHSTDEALSAS